MSDVVTTMVPNGEHRWGRHTQKKGVTGLTHLPPRRHERTTC